MDCQNLRQTDVLTGERVERANMNRSVCVGTGVYVWERTGWKILNWKGQQMRQEEEIN